MCHFNTCSVSNSHVRGNLDDRNVTIDFKMNRKKVKSSDAKTRTLSRPRPLNHKLAPLLILNVKWERNVLNQHHCCIEEDLKLAIGTINSLCRFGVFPVLFRTGLFVLSDGERFGPKRSSQSSQHKKNGIYYSSLAGTWTRTGQEQKRTDTEQAERHRLNTLGKRHTGVNNQGVAGDNQDRNRQAQGRQRRETGNETGTSKQNRKHSKS